MAYYRGGRGVDSREAGIRVILDQVAEGTSGAQEVALGVLTRQVGDAGGGRLSAECGVAAVMVVPVQEVWIGGGALGLAGVRVGVGPFLEQGAVEPLDFSVGLRSACSGA